MMTIIVLLILAGVGISTLIGENGLLNMANKAGEETKIKAAEEKLKLAILEYKAKMEEETLYSILIKVEGLESINPDNALEGPPYTVVVDGYEFYITGELEVEYNGRVDGIVPTIEKIEKNIVNKNEAKISFKASTTDSLGIKEVILIKNGVEIQIKEIDGKEGTKVEDEFTITGNGNYQLKVKGNNNRQKISDEVSVTELSSATATLQAGTVLNGQVILTVTAEAKQSNISLIEIYNGTTKVNEIKCENETSIKKHIKQNI